MKAPFYEKQITEGIMLHVCAPNYTNGNPRRVYVHIVNDKVRGSIVTGAWDEGYDGYKAVPETYWVEASFAHRINVSPTVYWAFVKAGEAIRKEGK
jgi:hypothetical protein